MRHDTAAPGATSVRAASRWRRFRVAAASALGGLVIRALGLTWRVRREGGEQFDRAMGDGAPVVFVFWHGEILPIAWQHRGRGIAPLISTHADGEIIARIVEGLGYRTVRGSTSRGGARAILELTRLLAAGVSVAVTPDGPRGPRHVFAPGALVVAHRSGRPIVLVRATARRAWRLRSWDRHLIPKPFATVTYHYGVPQPIGAATPRDAERDAPRFERMLVQLGDAPNEPG